MRSCLVFILGFSVACGPEDRQPLVKPRDSGRGGTASAGTNGRGGSSEGGEDSGGTGGATGANGGTGSANGGTGAGGGGGGASGGGGDFAPGEVYLFGSLTLEQPWAYAISHWRTPDTYILGFEGDFPDIGAPDLLRLGPTGLYHAMDLSTVLPLVGDVHRFVPDLVASLPFESISYPFNATENDPLVLSTSLCPAEEQGFLGVKTGPDGRLAYQCPDGVWHDEAGVVYDGEGELLSFGYNDLALINEAQYYVLHLGSGDRYEVPDFEDEVWIIRSADDGFRVVTMGNVRLELYFELWSVSADGTSRSLGLYPPISIEGNNSIGWIALDANDALFTKMLSTDMLSAGIVERRTIEGDLEVVFAPDEHNLRRAFGFLTGQ